MIQNDKTMTLDIPDARLRNKKQTDIDMLCCIVLLFVIQIPKALNKYDGWSLDDISQNLFCYWQFTVSLVFETFHSLQ